MRARRPAAVTVTAAVVLALAAAPLGAVPPPPRSEIVSTAWDGSEGAGNARNPSFRADGQVVAFQSYDNLVPGEKTHTLQEVYVRDLRTGEIEIVSVTSDGERGTSASVRPSISADGRFMVFMSRSRLVPDDTNFGDDVYLHDRVTKTTEMIARAPDGSPPSTVTGPGYISADGSTIAFVSRAANVLDGATGGPHVFVVDRETRELELVSKATDGTPGNDLSNAVSLSADGRFVSFTSRSDNLVPDDTNGTWDIFVRDRETGVTTLESRNGSGEQVNGRATSSNLSTDGRYIVFESLADNLVPNDTNYLTDIFVRDRHTGAVERVNVSSQGRESVFAGLSPELSDDGRFVVFKGYHGSLAPGNFNMFGDAYVHDRLTRRTERVRNDNGSAINKYQEDVTISSSGRFVGLSTTATNLAGGIDNGQFDVYRMDRGPALGPWGAPEVAHAGDRLRVSGQARFSGDLLASTERPRRGSTLLDQATGEELTSLSVALRPDEEDLLFRVGTADLPRIEDPYREVGAGVPGMVYGLSFTVDGVRHEMRVQPLPTRLVEWVAAAIFRCETVCSEIWRGDGTSVGFGTTGQEIVLPVALALVGAAEGSVLGDLRAFSGLGTTDTGMLEELDSITLEDVEIPAPTVRAALTPGTASAAPPAFQAGGGVAAALDSDRFEVELATGHLERGPAHVWLEVCQHSCTVTRVATVQLP